MKKSTIDKIRSIAHRKVILPKVFRLLSRTYLILVVLAGLLIAVCLWLFQTDTKLRQEFAPVGKEADRLLDVIRNQSEVVEYRTPGGVSGTDRLNGGNGLLNEWENCGLARSCPVVEARMLVALKNGRENQFAEEFFRVAGYKDIPSDCEQYNRDSSWCLEERFNSGFKVWLIINTADGYHHGAPQYEITGDKVWRYVEIEVWSKEHTFNVKN